MSNQTLKAMLTQAPKVQLSEEHTRLYKGGLLLFSAFVNEQFLDVPVLPENRFDHNGLFYTVPYVHSHMLQQTANDATLLVVWEVENRASHCPYRFEFKFIDETHYAIYLFDQTGARTIRHTWIEREGEDFYTTIPHTETITLSTIRDALASITN